MRIKRLFPLAFLPLSVAAFSSPTAKGIITYCLSAPEKAPFCQGYISAISDSLMLSQAHTGQREWCFNKSKDLVAKEVMNHIAAAPSPNDELIIAVLEAMNTLYPYPCKN